MKIKEFEALTLKDCLQQVRQDMGPEAVILDTKKTRVGGIMGFAQREAVRIVAATGVSVGDRDVSRSSTTRRTEQPVLETASIARLAELEMEVGELKRGILDLRQAAVFTPSAPDTLNPIAQTELRARLAASDVEDELANELMLGVVDDSELPQAMAARLRIGGPIDLTAGATKVVAFVGPTGVGKTTTIAKLAAQFALVEKRKVGLVTLDTYRIAAVEQLKTYGQIMDVPVEVVHDHAGIAPALERFAGFDLVLVDTAGRSQRNALQIGELKAVLDLAQCETHLVLTASTRERDMCDQIDRFSAVSIDRVLFTKLDEASTYGTLYSAAVRSHVPLSYLTTGQKVPEDIEPTTADRVVELVLS